MACRTAGRLGCGGGPVRLFPPLGGCKPMMLEKRKRDQRHQRVTVQTAPGSALKVVKPKLLFELLVRLLAHPARLDGARQPLE